MNSILDFKIESFPWLPDAIVFGVGELDWPLGWNGRRHQFAHCVEDLLELGTCVAADDVVVLG